MDSAASTPTSSPTFVPTFPVLVQIISGPGLRPLQPDGQYYPTHAVYQIRSQWLKSWFAPHHLIELAPCINSQNGNALSDFFIATFRDFDAYHGAMDVWHGVELDSNAFMKAIIFLDAIEDTTIARLIEPFEGFHTAKSSKHLPSAPPYHPRNLFEEWWATLDPVSWDQRRARMEHKASLPQSGAWLYYNPPGARASHVDPTSFSYETPAILEYEIWDRKEQADEPVEMIDWNATRQRGKLALQPSSSFTLYLAQLKAGSAPTSSDGEDAFELENEARPDTPNTSPPTSPRIDSDSCLADGVKPMSFGKLSKQTGHKDTLTTTFSHLHPDVSSTETFIPPATGFMKELEVMMSRFPTYADEDIDVPDSRKDLSATWVPKYSDLHDTSHDQSPCSGSGPRYDFANDNQALRQRAPPVGYGIQLPAHNHVAVDLPEYVTRQTAAWYASATDDVKPAGFSSEDADNSLMSLLDARLDLVGQSDGSNQYQERLVPCAAAVDHGYGVLNQQSLTELAVSSTNETYFDPEQEWYTSLQADPNIEKVYVSTVEHATGEKSEHDDAVQARISTAVCDDEKLSFMSDMMGRISACTDISAENLQSLQEDQKSSHANENLGIAAAPPADDQQSADSGLIVTSSSNFTSDERDPHDGGAIVIIGEPSVPAICEATNFWLKLFMLPIFDYFSLGLLPTLIFHPIFSFLVFLVLHFVGLRLQKVEEENRRLRGENQVWCDVCSLRHLFGDTSKMKREISGQREMLYNIVRQVT